MPIFAEIYGEWSDYFGEYKWQKLTTCAAYYHFDWNSITTCSNEKEEQDLTKLPNCSIYKTKEIKPKLINNISDVRNIRSYLITALYNSRLTLNSYWKSRVNHDMNKC